MVDNQLLQIRLFHQYYTDGLLHHVDVIPDAATQQFLNHYGLVAQSTAGRYSLCYFGAGTVSAFRAALNRLLDQQPLVFNLMGSMAHFNVISDLPLNWCGHLSYSSKNTLPSPSALELVSDLSPLVLAAAIGQIAIYPDQNQSCFDIHIKARQTRWDYYLFNRSRLKLNQPVVTNHQGIEFKTPLSVTWDSGESALLFSSGEQAFVMSERAHTRFDLVVQQASKPLINRLPIPQADNLTVKITDGKPLAYSEMYLYL